MKVIYSLAILSYFVFCEATNSTINEYCKDTCKDVCVPCQEPITCTEDQKDCGLGVPDPAFGGVCPPHSICVAKEFNCPCNNENGEPYALTTIVACDEHEILCTGGSPGNGCPGQDVCVSKGMDNTGKLCDGFCPVECEENQLHCSSNSETGCAEPTLCVPKSIDANGFFCPTQQCPVICLEIEFFCGGAVIELGCKEKDTCVPIGRSKSGELCAGTCPVTCDPITEKECDGQVDITGCKGPDVCHARARDLNGEFCPDNSDSHGCPIICPEDEILCPAKMNILGCKEQATCVPNKEDNNGNNCPETSVCPTICQPNEVPCEAGKDENGCNKPDVCVPQERDYSGNLCPIHCPAICGETEILCEGPREPLGCKAADTCSQRGTKTKGDNIGGLCPGHCPVSCKHHEVLCSSQQDCDGCITEAICRPKVKDNNGLFCEDDSASHNCPVECDETIGHVICPTYESALGCKPKATCIPRPEISKGEYCPSHSVCSKECQLDEMLCTDGADSRGCKNAELCLARGEDNDGTLCPAICPPTCTNAQFFCAGAIQNNGCRGEAHCVEKKADVNGIECPEVCPIICTANEHKMHGGSDARGCPLQDTCVVPCTGGDSCCNSVNNKCDVGEGDCDSDADCLDGLKCGENNCPTTRSEAWDNEDDCCYKPATWVPIMQIIKDEALGFSSAYWTNDQLLNENSSLTEQVNAKYSAFLNVPFQEIRMCVGESASNCVSHTFDKVWSSAKELFNAGYIRDPTVEKDGILGAYGPESGSYRDCEMQRPGFNIECNDGNKARWGFCNNCASQSCQESDDSDADSAIGIGLAGQDTPNEMGAGWTNYFASGAGTCTATSMTYKRVWVSVKG